MCPRGELRTNHTPHAGLTAYAVACAQRVFLQEDAEGVRLHRTRVGEGGRLSAQAGAVLMSTNTPRLTLASSALSVRRSRRQASVSNATSASCCTSVDDPTSCSEPSSACAARPALLSMSLAIRASIVCAAMMRHAV